MWSKKQQLSIDAIYNPDISYVLATGAVRSGKTYSSIYGFMGWMCENFSGHEFVLGARSQRQWDANLWRPAVEFMQATGTRYRRVDGGYYVSSALGGANIIWPALGTDQRSMDKVMGFGLGGALLDEAPKMPKNFVNQMGLRCDQPGATLVLTMNPEGPQHWMKREYIDRVEEINGIALNFELRDNPTLDEAFIARIDRQFTGAWHARMVMGQWTATTGAVYPHASAAIRQPPRAQPVTRYSVSVDVGDSGVTHALLIAEYPNGRHWAINEWRHHGINDGQLTHSEQVQSVLTRLVGDRHISQWIVDPAASNWRKTLEQHIRGRATPANNDVVAGIQAMSRWLQEGWFNISPVCRHLSREMVDYAWDERAGERGDDRPVKDADHGPDAGRYYVSSTKSRKRPVVRFRK